MLDRHAVANGLTIYNYQLSIEEVVASFSHYDSLFFFCPKYTRSVIEMAVKLVLDEMSNYDPLKANWDLMSYLTRDIELYQSRNPHPYLEDSNYLDHIELVCSQIEECVDYHVRCKLPMNQQFQVVWPNWVGNNLTFALRIF